VVVGAFLIIIAIAFVAGIGGGYVIARNLSGLAAFGAFLLWLGTPVLILAVLFSASTDPTLTTQQASYNFSMALVLTSIIVAIPWGIANLIGGLLGHRHRKARKAVPLSSVEAPQPPTDGLPDWRRSDSPSLSLAELGVKMREIAERAGIPERVLPHIGPIGARDGEYIDRDKFDYIYIGQKRGQPMFDHRVVIADQLMYLIFKDRTWMIAAGYVGGATVPPKQDPARIAERQQHLLAGIDPRWGRQFAKEGAFKAGR
jgi:hypothetical protein